MRRLNALYVGLARAAGLPARDLYGIRVAPSKFGYKSLGASSEVITKAQHCRSEVYLAGFGWVPVDAADVRKVVLEEPPKNLAIDDPEVLAARKTLFGAGKAIGLRTILRMTSRSKDPSASGSRFSCTRKPSAETLGSTTSIPIPSNTRLRQGS
jgi:hypothetical protein